MPKVTELKSASSVHRYIPLTWLAVGLGLAAIVGAAQAQPSVSQETSTYVGGNIGLLNNYRLDCNDGAACERNGKLSGKVYIGHNSEILGGLGIEAMAFSVGSAKGSLQRNGVSEAGSIKQSGVGASVVLPWEMGDFGLKARLGVGYVRGSVSYASGGSQARWSFQPLLGLGGSYALSKQMTLNLDWDAFSAIYGSGTSRMGMLSAGISFKF
ncbi:MAG: porin family protein [Burkholderiaceae bacterium]|nr:porin family protein [Burkholderiaceae bacterium]